MKIAIIKLENTLKSALYAIEELFFISNKFCKKESELPINTKILELQDLNKNEIFDIVLIPPLMGEENFNFHIPTLNKWLNNQYHKGTTLCSACVGSFFLADAKLLENKKATTHWAYTDFFKRSFPNVNLDSDKILIEDNRIITAGGVNAYMDLSIYLVEKIHSNKTASTLANLLVIDKTRSSQKPYKDFSTIFLFDDEEIKECIKWMKDNLQETISNEILARKFSISERTFTRRFKKALNITPNTYLQNLRVEKAKELLITSEKSFEQITFEVGFFNESSFRKLFKKVTSLNPKEFKRRYKQNL